MKFDISKNILHDFIRDQQKKVNARKKDVEEADNALIEANERLDTAQWQLMTAQDELANLMRLEIAEALIPAIKSENKPTL